MNLNLNWYPLLFAALPAGWAIADHIHQKAPRRAAILGALAVAFIVAGVPALLAWFKHPLKPGLVMVSAVVILGASAALIWHDIIKAHYKKPLFGRQGKPHHYRPQYWTAAFVLSALLVFGSIGAVFHGMGHGVGQMWNGFTTSKPGA